MRRKYGEYMGLGYGIADRFSSKDGIFQGSNIIALE
jgi:hypothetical protein